MLELLGIAWDEYIVAAKTADIDDAETGGRNVLQHLVQLFLVSSLMRQFSSQDLGLRQPDISRIHDLSK